MAFLTIISFDVVLVNLNGPNIQMMMRLAGYHQPTSTSCSSSSHRTQNNINDNDGGFVWESWYNGKTESGLMAAIIFPFGSVRVGTEQDATKRL